MNIQQAKSDFLLACRADGLRPATVTWYSSILRPLTEHFTGCNVQDITTKQLRLYIVALQERETRYTEALQKPQQRGGLSRDSIASHVTALHRFFNWCSKEYNTENPMQNIRRPKRAPKAPKAINPKDLVKLFEATGDNEAGSRDRALLAFLADTGARLGGMRSLTIDRLYLEDRKAYLTEKGQKSRIVVYTDMTAALVGAWLAIKPDGQHVFCHAKDGTQLTNSGVNEILKRLKRRAGVRGRVNPHAFRHNFARQYILNGGSVVFLSKLLGHADINTTIAYYAIFLPDELAEVHKDFSPMNNLRGRK